MKRSIEPLPVSGRVFVDKILVFDRPDLSLRGPLVKGDIKLIAIAKHPAGVHGYSGFLSACIFDGNGWRRFALRDGAAVKSTYKSTVERKSLLGDVAKSLAALKGRVSIWADRAFWVKKEIDHAKPCAVSCDAQCGAEGREAETRSKKMTVPVATQQKARVTKEDSPIARHSTDKRRDPLQLTLF